DPKVLAGPARGKARARLGALAEACDGHFSDHHARLARMLLDQIDDLSARIATVTSLLDQAITSLPVATPSPGTALVDPSTGEVLPAPVAYASAVERISQIPGGGPDSARAVIGEIGLDMAVFGTAG